MVNTCPPTFYYLFYYFCDGRLPSFLGLSWALLVLLMELFLRQALLYVCMFFWPSLVSSANLDLQPWFSKACLSSRVSLDPIIKIKMKTLGVLPTLSSCSNICDGPWCMVHGPPGQVRVFVVLLIYFSFSELILGFILRHVDALSLQDGRAPLCLYYSRLIKTEI